MDVYVCCYDGQYIHTLDYIKYKTVQNSRPLPVLLCLLRELPVLYTLDVIKLPESLIGWDEEARYSFPAAAAHATRIKHATALVNSVTPIVYRKYRE